MTQKEIAEDIKTAVQTLRQGGLILYPTNTIWGIGRATARPYSAFDFHLMN